MIGFPGIIPGFPVATDGTPADEQTTKPRDGEATGPQGRSLLDYPMGYGAFGSNGGNCNNPCGFPNYGSLYLGTFQTYDWMLEHPIIQHARSQAHDPIISAALSYEAKKGVAQKRKDFIKTQIDRVWEQVGDMLRAMDYGFAPFEKVWKITGGTYGIDCLKPLTVYRNGIVTDPHGSFAGIAPWGTSKEDWLGVHKSFLFTYDKIFGNLYGRSRLENVRATAWRDWLDAATDLVKLSRKISGKLGIFSTPMGGFKNATGGVTPWSDLAAQMGSLLTTDASLIHFYHMGSVNPQTGTMNPIIPSQNNFEQFVELTKVKAVNLEMQDFGSNSPAIASIIERMEKNEMRMFAGYFQSPRTGMATKGGTKADAGVHKDTAVVNCENVAGSLVRAINRQITNELLVLNYGEGARDSVWALPPKLTDDNVATDMTLLDGVLTNADGLGTSFIEQINWNTLADRRDIPHDAPIVLESLGLDDETGDGPASDDPNAPEPPLPTKPAIPKVK